MKRLIIAEDYAPMRLAIRASVETIGDFEFDEVPNGRQLVDAVFAHHYDAIITDDYMPILSGLEAVTMIRTFNSKIPICMLCGQGDKKSKDEAYRHGVNAYIVKASDTQASDLLNFVEQYLKKK